MQTIKKFIFVSAIFSLAVFGFAASVDAAAPTALINPLQNTIDANAPVQSLSALIINTLFGIAGSIALVMFVWGGILWLTAMGNAKQVDKGKQIFQWTTLGIIAMFASYTLVSFVFSSLSTAPVGTTGGGGNGGSNGKSTTTPKPGGGTTDTNIYCCVEYGVAAKTVTGANQCAGSNKVKFSGSCEEMKFCKKSPSVTSATVTNTCLPELKDLACNGGALGVSSYTQCLVEEGLGLKGSTSKSECEKIGGSCETKINNKTGGSYFAGFCPGKASVQCWIPDKAPSSTDKCQKVGGSCIVVQTTSCSGAVLSGLCSGSSGIKCCVPQTP